MQIKKVFELAKPTRSVCTQGCKLNHLPKVRESLARDQKLCVPQRWCRLRPCYLLKANAASSAGAGAVCSRSWSSIKSSFIACLIFAVASCVKILSCQRFKLSGRFLGHCCCQSLAEQHKSLFCNHVRPAFTRRMFFKQLFKLLEPL